MMGEGAQSLFQYDVTIPSSLKFHGNQLQGSVWGRDGLPNQGFVRRPRDPPGLQFLEVTSTDEET
jgi:hypothetical protein